MVGIVGAIWFGRGRKPVRQNSGLLADAILGASKQMVQSVFGPPRAAGGGLKSVPEMGRQGYWEADTWYYAVNPRRRVAMAIRFEQGVARDVEFVAHAGV